MAIESFTNQLRMLQDVKSNIISFKRYMVTIKEKYKNQINSAESGLFVQDFTIPLKNKKNIFEDKVNETIDKIEKDLQILSKQETEIQRLMQEARNV